MLILLIGVCAIIFVNVEPITIDRANVVTSYLWCPLTSTWPRLRRDVGLEEGKY